MSSDDFWEQESGQISDHEPNVQICKSQQKNHHVIILKGQVMICDVIAIWRYVCMSLYTDYLMAISVMDLVQTKSVASKTLQTYSWIPIP